MPKKSIKENNKVKIKEGINDINYECLGQKFEKYNIGLAYNSPSISFPQTYKNKTTKYKENKNKKHNLFLAEKNLKINFEKIII